MAEPARSAAAAAEYPPLHGGKLLFLTAAIATASFMEILDMTIVNVSVPAISGSLGVNVIFPLWLQTTVGYTATWAGLAAAPVGLLALVAAPIVGRNMNRMNLRLAASFAFCVFGFAVFWTATLNDTASFSQFATPRFLQGLGIAFFFLPLNQIMLSGVPPSDLASASGLSNFVRTMSGSIATAMTVFIWNRRTDYHHAVLTEHIRNSADTWTQYQAQLSTHGITGTGAFGYVDQVITSQAMTLGVNDVFHVLGWMYLLLIPFIWLAKPPFTARGADAAH